MKLMTLPSNISRHLSIPLRELAQVLYTWGFMPDAWWYHNNANAIHKRHWLSMCKKYPNGIEIDVVEHKDLTFNVLVSKNRIAIRFFRSFKTIPLTLKHVQTLLVLAELGELHEFRKDTT